MIQINQYIIEKLKIGKTVVADETKLEEIADLIIKICDIKLNWSANTPMINCIYDWVKDYGIDDMSKLNCYSSYKNLKDVLDGQEYDRLESHKLLQYVKNRPGKVNEYAQKILNKEYTCANLSHAYYNGELYVYEDKVLIFLIPARQQYFIFELK